MLSVTQWGRVREGDDGEEGSPGASFRQLGEDTPDAVCPVCDEEGGPAGQ